MLRERSSAPPLPPSRRAQALLGRDTATPQAPPPRWQHQANRRFRPLADEEASKLLGIRADSERDSDLDEDWRQNAQMLSERDEMLLLRGGGDALDVAPVNRRQLVERRRRSPQTPTTIDSASSRQSPEAGEPSGSRRTIFSLAKRAQDTGKQRKARQQEKAPQGRAKPGHKLGQLLGEDSENELQDEEDELEEQEDDNSSISFAQSGCHSILSAWRLKAAKRRARQLISTKGSNPNANTRPRSVLSNSSSLGKKSSASTAYTLGSRAGPLAGASNRIPLGPKSAQHFVTNSRRRRRANELILNTLEARRRAISLNRQNVLAATGSLFGSESYLGAATPLDDYQRLSLSPSPGAGSKPRRSPYDDAGQSTAVAELTRRTALSDLGGRRSPAMEAQRSKLLLMSAAARTNRAGGQKVTRGLSPTSPKGAQRPPPLAKLDQNSSDLCSSNESSSGAESKAESSSSSGSQFTQLVTSELTPSRMLMGEETQLDADYRPSRLSSVGLRARSPQVMTPPIRPASREAAQQKHHQQLTAGRESPRQAGRTTANKENLRQSQQVKQQQPQLKQQVSTTSEEDDKLGKLRRGALKRDSIRRLRLSQKQHQRDGTRTGDASSSSNDYDQQQVSRARPGSSRLASGRDQKPEGRGEQQQQSLRPLSKARKLDIESNPFLNRHHFRTMSARSTESRQSYAASSQRPRDSPVGSARQTTSSTSQHARRLESRSPSSPPPPPLPSKNQRGRLEDDSKRLRMPQIDLENLRQAERLIKDLQESRSPPPPVVTRRQFERPVEERQTMSERVDLEARAAPLPPRRRTRAQSRLDAEPSGDDEQNVFKTTTRLVHEGARSSDNLKSDLRGASQQVELLEKWRHERQPPVRRPDGSTFSEQKFTSERLEVRRSRERLDGAASRPRSISPPAEFSDNPDSRGWSRPRAAGDRGQSPGASPRRAPLPQPKAAPPRQATRPSETSYTKSVPVTRLASAPEIPPTKRTEARARDAQKPATCLPQFERTADDEFRKRVDQLRQMARANLEASEARQQQEAAAARRRELVRPLSTNWDGPKGEADQEATGSSLEPQTSSSRRLQSSSLQPASTNLDEMLLADRYQRPLATTSRPVGAWRRSNSSLASLGSSTRPIPTAKRPLSPNSGTSLLSHSTVSDNQPASSQIGAPMRVVVRERSAPQLDFAQVEQRPVAQRASSSLEQPATRAGNSAIHSARQFASEPRSRQLIAPSKPTSEPSKTIAAQSSGGHPTRSSPTIASTSARPVQQRAGFRSPEFGRAANSSNDDSAIASSVSSPSSFSVPMSSGVVQSATQRASFSSAPQSGSVERPPITQSRAPDATSVESPAPPSAPHIQSIQSILRRQQAASGSGQFPLIGVASSSVAPPAQHHFAFTQAQVPAPIVAQQSFGADQRQLSSPPPPPLLGLAGELQTAASTAPIKRVHFNDRTSVRSFESISSTNSNTTAIAQSNLDEFGARQQVGSPDSMGSGSTSRLSCESPAFGESRRPGGAAAIYAVRGDPDLELAGGGGQLPARSAPLPADQVAQRLRMGPSLYGPQPSSQQQQQQQPPPPPLLHQTTTTQTRIQFVPQMPHMQHQVPLPGAIRMTAPPAIGTSQTLGSRQHPILSPQQHQMPVPQFGRPQQFAAGQLVRMPQAPLDEEDPDYALRLRQAATRRAVFNFGQQPSPQQHAQQVAPGELVRGASSDSARGRQHAANLANFHTEV